MRLIDNFSTRFDGWVNFFTGLGIFGQDKRMNTQITAGKLLTEDDLIALYQFDGVGTRIIDVFTEDMTRKWFRIVGDTDNNFDKELLKFDGKERLIECVRWALLHGGCLGILGIDDGGDYEDEVREDNIKQITHIHVYDRWRSMWTTADLYTDPMHPKYGMPQYYNIFPITPTGIMGLPKLSGSPKTATLGAFRVHESRVLRFDGKPTPLKSRIRNRYWNDSYLLAGFERIRGLGEGYAGIEHIISEFIIGKLTIDGLQGMIAAGKEDLVHKRLSLLEMSKKNMGILLMDKEEEYERISSTVTGVDDLMNKLIEGASMAYGIPVTRLAGRSPAGMNATGESDESIYHDKIGGMQFSTMYTPIVKLARYLSLAEMSKFKVPPDECVIQFVPLKSLTEKEQADLRKAVAESDNIYINNGVLRPEEVTKSRFGGEEYSMETVLGDDRDENGAAPEPEITEREKMEYDLLMMKAQGKNNQPQDGNKDSKTNMDSEDEDDLDIDDEDDLKEMMEKVNHVLGTNLKVELVDELADGYPERFPSDMEAVSAISDDYKSVRVTDDIYDPEDFSVKRSGFGPNIGSMRECGAICNLIHEAAHTLKYNERLVKIMFEQTNNGIGKFPSGYAATGEKEFFAESVAAHLLNSILFRTINPGMCNYLYSILPEGLYR